MLRWLQRLGPGSHSLTGIHKKFLEMLVDGRHVFDAAANALLGGTDPEVIREDLFSTDRRINRTEQEIRREIVVHGSLHGAATFPALLVMMSLVKDAERVGDYAKNIFDLAVEDASLGEEARHLVAMKDHLSKLIVRAHGVYEQQSMEGARDLLKDALAFEDECDAAVHELLHVEDRNTAAGVLAFRYFKRIASHVSNIVTSLVVPLDKLDFFDEPKEPPPRKPG